MFFIFFSILTDSSQIVKTNVQTARPYLPPEASSSQIVNMSVQPAPPSYLPSHTVPRCFQSLGGNGYPRKWFGILSSSLTILLSHGSRKPLTTPRAQPALSTERIGVLMLPSHLLPVLATLRLQRHITYIHPYIPTYTLLLCILWTKDVRDWFDVVRAVTTTPATKKYEPQLFVVQTHSERQKEANTRGRGVWTQTSTKMKMTGERSR